MTALYFSCNLFSLWISCNHSLNHILDTEFPLNVEVWFYLEDINSIDSVKMVCQSVESSSEGETSHCHSFVIAFVFFGSPLLRLGWWCVLLLLFFILVCDMTGISDWLLHVFDLEDGQAFLQAIRSHSVAEKYHSGKGKKWDHYR